LVDVLYFRTPVVHLSIKSTRCVRA
jgi:hypothetical protein